MPSSSLLLLVALVGPPSLATGDAAMRSQTPRSVTIEWSAPADRTLSFRVPPGDVELVTLEGPQVIQAPMRRPGLLPVRIPEGATRIVFRIESTSPGSPGDDLDPSTLRLTQALDLAIDRRGRVRIGAAELLAFWPSIAVDGLALVTREGPVAIHVEDANADGTLGPGEWIEFVGSPGATRYDRRRVYRLFQDENPESGRILRMENVPPPLAGSPAPLASSTLFEQRLRYMLGVRNGEEDNFFWAFALAPAGFSTTLDLPALAPSAPGARIAVTLRGSTSHEGFDPDHHVRVRVNGTLLADASFDGLEEVILDLPVPDGVLAATNSFVLEMPGDTGAPNDQVLLDRIVVDAPRQLALVGGETSFDVRTTAPIEVQSAVDLVAFDLTEQRSPRRQSSPTSGTSAFVGMSAVEHPLLVTAGTVPPASMTRARGASLLTSDAGADLLIVTARAFRSAADRLATHRASQGRRVRVVEMDDVYGAYSNGERDPLAIRSLVEDAVARWEAPAPRHLLLMGDGTFDYRSDLLPYQEGGFVPVALYDSAFNETSTDNAFVDLDGDLLPEIAVGRIPAATLAEADRVIDKVMAYEARPFGSGFETRALFVADNALESWETPYFEILPGELAATLPPWATSEILQLSQMSAAETTAAILDRINAGTVWVNYIGHGSVRTWAQEQIFANANVPSLTNVDRPAFFVSMTCSNGLFQFPNVGPTGLSQRSMAEVLLVESDAGAIAMLTATHPALPDPLPDLNRFLLAQAFGGKVNTLGEITRSAKLGVDALVPGALDLLRGLTLFGDPSLVLKTNHDPVPRAAAPTETSTGDWADLDGSASFDPDGQSLVFRWSLLSAPEGSSAELTQAGSPIARLWPDLEGRYRISLEISDGLVWSAPLTLEIEATGEPVSRNREGGGCGPAHAPRGPSLGLLLLPAMLVVTRRRHRTAR